MKEFKLSEQIEKLNKSDFLHHIIIFDHKEDNKYMIVCHDMPSYGKCDPDIEDTDEWYEMFWTTAYSFDKDTGIITFSNYYKGPEEGDKIIIDCDFSDYIREYKNWDEE